MTHIGYQILAPVTNGQFNGLSEKEIFESDLAGIAQDAGKLRQDFLRCFLLLDEDTNTGGNALLEDFLTENETAPDYYILAGLRLLNKNTTGASEALSNCSTISPTKDILRPFCIMLESIQLGQYPLLNQSHIDELEDLVYDENVIGCAQARALLSMVQEIDFPMEIETEVVHSRSLRQEKNDPAIASFTIQPTPANNTLWLAYQYLPGMEKVTVSIVDIMGKVMIRSDLSRINGLYELNTANWPTGFYLVEVFIDELTMGVQKCEIQH